MGVGQETSLFNLGVISNGEVAQTKKQGAEKQKYQGQKNKIYRKHNYILRGRSLITLFLVFYLKLMIQDLRKPYAIKLSSSREVCSLPLATSSFPLMQVCQLEKWCLFWNPFSFSKIFSFFHKKCLCQFVRGHLKFSSFQNN